MCRLARIVGNPVLATVSRMMVDYRSSAHVSVHEYPSLVGLRFRDLHFYFPSEPPRSGVLAWQAAACLREGGGVGGWGVAMAGPICASQLVPPC
jgi:hypothetical protein